MSRRVVLIVLGVIAFFFVLGFGAIAGGAATYFALQARPVRASVSEAVSGAVARAEAKAGAKQTVSGQEREGILIAAVEEDSPAEEAGLVRGDIVTEVNGEAISQVMDLRELLAEAEPGDEVTLSVLHGDEVRSLRLTLGERDGQAYVGVRLCNLLPVEGQPRLRDFERLDLTGALIQEVVADSPAEEAGVNAGELIVSVDGTALEADTDLGEVIRSYEPGDTITLEVRQLRDAETREVEVTLGENPDQEGQAYLGIRYLSLPHMGSFEGQDLLPQPESGDEGFMMPQMPFEDMPFLPDFPQLLEGIEQAIIVAEVTRGSPAEGAGLQSNDVITAVDGEAIGEPQALVEAIQSHEPGDEITLTVFRQGEEGPLSIEVQLGENPEQPGVSYLGVRIGGFMRFREQQRPDQNFRFNFGNEA